MDIIPTIVASRLRGDTLLYSGLQESDSRPHQVHELNVVPDSEKSAALQKKMQIVA